MQVGLAVVRVSRPAAGRRPIERRGGQRAAHRPGSAARWRGRALQLAELAPEVGDRGVRAIVDPRPQHRGDEYRGPGRRDNKENELSHMSQSVVMMSVKRTPDGPECRLLV
jgi:hypothetical protein